MFEKILTSYLRSVKSININLYFIINSTSEKQVNNTGWKFQDENVCPEHNEYTVIKNIWIKNRLTVL